MAIESYLSPTEAAAIRGEFHNLGATIAELNDHPAVTFRRQDGTNNGPVSCISIKLEQQVSGMETATALQGHTRRGTLKAFTTAFPAVVKPGDRFRWQEQTCVVDSGPFDKFDGILTIPFLLQVTNRTV